MRARYIKSERFKLDPLALEMLVCPMTKTQLTLNEQHTELISAAARLAYPIKKGVPLLYLEEARHLSEKELDHLKNIRPKKLLS